MAWFRRSRRPSTELVAPEPATSEVSLRTERALVALAVHMRDLTSRLDHLEDEMASHGDVLEVQVHAAKLAAEMSRLSVNLRAQIDDVASKLPAARDTRLDTLAATIIDLSDAMETRPDDLGEAHDPWARTA